MEHFTRGRCWLTISHCSPVALKVSSPSVHPQPHFESTCWPQSCGRKENDSAISNCDDSEYLEDKKRCYLLRQRSVRCKRKPWPQSWCEPSPACRSTQRGSSPGATAQRRRGSGWLNNTGTTGEMKPPNQSSHKHKHKDHQTQNTLAAGEVIEQLTSGKQVIVGRIQTSDFQMTH